MYNFSSLVCAYSLGMLTCLVAVMLGAFIERTSYLIREKRTLEQQEKHIAFSKPSTTPYLHLLPISKLVNK